jgi:hypothetical protein
MGRLEGMTKSPNSSTPSPKGDPAREQRLAQALRANLRRRKAQAPKDSSSEDKGERQ